MCLLGDVNCPRKKVKITIMQEESINDVLMRENGGFGYKGRVFWNRFR